MDEILAILIVFSFAAFVCTGIYKLIKTKMDRDQGMDAETFNRLAEAFVEHRKEMNKRVENLEAIIADQDKNNAYPEIEAPEKESSLSNNLQQKNKVRS
jgi:hypothetical protein